jgi:hypothetical protein
MALRCGVSLSEVEMRDPGVLPSVMKDAKNRATRWQRTQKCQIDPECFYAAEPGYIWDIPFGGA